MTRKEGQNINTSLQIGGRPRGLVEWRLQEIKSSMLDVYAPSALTAWSEAHEGSLDAKVVRGASSGVDAAPPLAATPLPLRWMSRSCGSPQPQIVTSRVRTGV